MTFAFSARWRDPGVGTCGRDSREQGSGQCGACWSAVVSAIITLPALIEVNIGTAEEPLIVPTAFYAVVSVAVIGLYLAFLIPIWLRWRMGDYFEPGSLEQRGRSTSG